ncbi:XrtA/PEP-CTERM system TPR-repeat protein PrsT [Flocculibacter collagenilyticus]|uniref:XrtA/PEP-CTERM system TPR-repeat protein PrsT n=1 Tax=Flocculibacter collagenilyticus TaxID=2744479 RepID=UPI0018F43B4C|nr:XrtA/PEP-CTERM system TPR-repeat protein PrsT [Flocculibacter collagenilyticus]
MKSLKMPKVAILSFTLMTILSGCNNKTPQEYITNAQTLLDEGKNQAAILELKNAIKADMENASARYILGSTYLTLGQAKPARKELTKALELGYPADDISIKIVHAMYLQNNYSEILSYSKTLNNLTPEQQNIIFLYQTISHLALNKLEDAMDTFNNAKAISTESLHTRLAQAYVAQHQQAINEAISITEGILAQQPEHAHTLLLQAQLHRTNNNHAATRDALLKYKALTPFDLRAQLLLAQTHLELGETEAANTLIASLLQRLPNNGFVNFLKGQSEFNKGNYQETLNHIEKAHQNSFQTPVTRILAGISAYKLDKLEQAYHYLSNSIVNLPKEHKLHRLYAYLQLQLGYITDAQSTVENLTDISESDADLLANTGVRLAFSGDLISAQSYLKKATSLNSTPENLLHAGVIKVASDDASGLTNIEQALEQDPNLERGWLVLALYYIKHNEMDKAWDIAEQWEETDVANAKVIKGKILSLDNKVEQAAKYYYEALEVQPDLIPALMDLVEIEYNKKQYDQARSLSQRIIDKWPNHQRALMQQVSIGLETKSLDSVERHLLNHIENYPNYLSPRIALATLYKLQNKPQQVIAQLDKFRTVLNSDAWLLFADANLKVKGPASAQRYYDEWRRKHPTSYAAWLRGIGIRDMNGDLNGALELIEDAPESIQNVIVIQLLKLGYLTRTNQLEQANKLVTKLYQLNVPAEKLLKYQGDLAWVEKDYKKAYSFYVKNYDINPNYESAVKVAMAERQLNGPEASAKFLEQDLAKTPKDQQKLNSLAEFYLQHNQYAQAEQHYRTLLTINKNSAITLNNLAWTLYKQDRLEEALATAEQALNNAPQSVNILDTLGTIAIASNDYAAAIRYFEQALTVQPNNVDLQLRLLQTLMLADNKQEAITLSKNISPANAQQQEQLNNLKRKFDL